MPADNNESRLVWFLGVLTLILRILLWPLRRLVLILFPARDLDGLSPAVCSKAAQSFVSELRQLSPGNVALETFSTSGFNAIRAEASTQNQLILVYLHSPLHRQANAVRQNLLLNDAVLQFLNENQNHVLTMGVSIHTAQGAHLAQLLGAASYPLVALLQPTSSSNALQLVFKAEGPFLQKMTAQYLLGQLHNAVQRHQAVVLEAETRRLQREQEAQLRREQDLEFQETLRADQERQRLQQEAEQRELERVQQVQQESQRIQDLKEQKLQDAKDLLRDEPSSGGTRVRFVLPTGAKIDRRFHSEESIKSLRAFLTVHMNESDMDEIENIGLSTSYPKRSYEESENDLTLEEAGLSPQSVLMVQDLDA